MGYTKEEAGGIYVHAEIPTNHSWRGVCNTYSVLNDEGVRLSVF